MKLLLSYLKSHRKSLFLFGIFILTYGMLIRLFEVPFIVAGYSTAVCVFFGVVIAVYDFSHYREKHRMLVHMEKEITDSAEHLPRPQDLIEEDYQAIIRSSFADKTEQVYRRDRQYHDMMEYYTMWAHQIKTPIAAMGLLLQTGQEDGEKSGEAWIEEKKELQGELFKIEQYVEMVLCYLRLGENASDYVIRRCDLDSILRQAVHKYASQFIRNKCRLIYEPVHCSVLTDEKWLLFMVEQVISNALKYTREGRVEIFVRPEKILVIKDNGIGIAAEDLPRIFERGYTGYNGRADKKSTGIGLYLCRRIAENLGHKISAVSEAGKGTEIRIDLQNYNYKAE